MTEQELGVKLAETETRTRANAARIEKLEQRQDHLEKLATAVEVLAAREESVERDVKEIKSDVKSITEKPAKRWDTMVDRALYALVGAAVSYFAAGGGA